MRILWKHLSRDTHEWTDDQREVDTCPWHPLYVCSCDQYNKKIDSAGSADSTIKQIESGEKQVDSETSAGSSTDRVRDSKPDSSDEEDQEDGKNRCLLISMHDPQS